jgi:hypothetical protein
MSLLGPYLIACALLAVAGLMKAVRPADTARALHGVLGGIGLRPATIAVRAGACVEGALGIVALVIPWPVPACAVAVSYLAFAVFVLEARRRGGSLASCGCFGTADTPPTLAHVVVDVGLAASALVVAASGLTGTLGAVLASQPLHGVPLALLSALGAWLTFLVLSPLARLQATRRLLREGRAA